MDLKSLVPLVVYDDNCYLCVKFAKIVNFFARGKLLLVGHYTDLGEKLRNEVLDSSALKMFWFIDEKTAYGGRAALLPLLCAMFHAKGRSQTVSVNESCDVGCKNTKAVFLRSASLLSNSKKIQLES